MLMFVKDTLSSLCFPEAKSRLFYSIHYYPNCLCIQVYTERCMKLYNCFFCSLSFSPYFSHWQMLQPQFKPHSIQQVLLRLFQVIPGHSLHGSWDTARCLRCAVVGNSGNLRGASYGSVINSHTYIMRWGKKAKENGIRRMGDWEKERNMSCFGWLCSLETSCKTDG